MTSCLLCGATLAIGSWPWCPHGSVLPSDAQPFEAVAIFKNAEGHYIFPGRSSQKPPAGYERVELRTTVAVRKFEAEYGRILKRERQAAYARNEAMFQTTRKPRLDKLRQEFPNLSPSQRAIAQRVLERAASR